MMRPIIFVFVSGFSDTKDDLMIIRRNHSTITLADLVQCRQDARAHYLPEGKSWEDIDALLLRTITFLSVDYWLRRDYRWGRHNSLEGIRLDSCYLYSEDTRISLTSYCPNAEFLAPVSWDSLRHRKRILSDGQRIGRGSILPIYPFSQHAEILSLDAWKQRPHPPKNGWLDFITAAQIQIDTLVVFAKLSDDHTPIEADAIADHMEARGYDRDEALRCIPAAVGYLICAGSLGPYVVDVSPWHPALLDY